MMSLPIHPASPPARTSSSGAPLRRFAPAPLLNTGHIVGDSGYNDFGGSRFPDGNRPLHRSFGAGED